MLLAYSNGLLVLWDLHSLETVAVRGGTQEQRAQLGLQPSKQEQSKAGKKTADSEAPGDSAGEEKGIGDEEDQEICSVCWACSQGSVAAVGYTTGDVLLWGFPSFQAQGHAKGSWLGGLGGALKVTGLGGGSKILSACQEALSGTPLATIELASAREAKVPVTVLRWSPDHIPQAKGSGATGLGGGRLFILGGDMIGMPEAVSVRCPPHSPAASSASPLPLMRKLLLHLISSCCVSITGAKWCDEQAVRFCKNSKASDVRMQKGVHHC